MVNSTIATTVYINPVTGSDTSNGSRLSPFKSLTRALNSVRSPAILQLAPGTYDVVNGEVFPLIIPNGIWLVGNEATKGQGIVIEGSGDYQIKSFGLQNITLILASDAQLMGVTITNPINKGTGVWIDSTSPTVANNTFIKCRREGIFISGNAKPAILDNVFVLNASAGLVMARNSKGEILRNVMQRNSIGIALSDFSAPLVANNKLSENRIAMALSREARPILRYNLFADNSSGGLLLNGSSTPDFGSSQDPAGNIFRDNNEYDVQNATSINLVSAGNLLNLSLVKGLVDFVTTTIDNPRELSINSSFPDLNGHWAASFIEAVYEKGLISGFPDGTFAPEAPITRAQYAAIVSKTFQLPLKKQTRKFTDINSEFWAASAIYRGAGMGFISGFPDGSFRPNQNLTKFQAIVSIVSGLKLKGGNPNILAMFSDRAQIPSYATNAMAIATQKLLVVNYPQWSQLEPLRETTRAEVVALIYQALVTLDKQKAIVSPYIVKPDGDIIPSFTDLTGHWAETFIRSLVSLDLTSGFADGKYKPDIPMTRAQYAALIVKAFNPTPKRLVNDFVDIPTNSWNYKPIQAAAQGGFVGGYSDGTFRPQENVQRLQVMVSLVNGLRLTAAHGSALQNFTDSQTLPNYARTAVATATQQRIVVNYPDPKKLEPKREATRAEVAAMVYQTLVAIKRTAPVNSPYIIFPTGN
ncbi:MAG: S-layer homology domain-containing protein [Cyanobacteria bacterium P01_D01_bin.116]